MAGGQHAMIQSESFLMRAFRQVGFEGLAWSLRRLHCPVPADALVLEVGFRRQSLRARQRSAGRL